MKRTLIQPDLTFFPELYHPILESSRVFDSSCSREAKVYFIDKEAGLFLKTAAAGTLKDEATMTAYFHSKGLSAQVLSYHSGEKDWLLTSVIPGEDCTHPIYLADPIRLCDTLAQQLRQLHELDAGDCPVRDRNEVYLRTALQGYRQGVYEADLFRTHWEFSSKEEALEEVNRNGSYLRPDALLHGDYCLPNIMLDNWRFSGFLDLGFGGIGDRHIDLLWGVWTLYFNLHTDRYRDRFLDAYGRDAVNMECLRTVAAMEIFR